MADVILRLYRKLFLLNFELKKRDKQTHKHAKFRGKHKLSTDFNIFMMEVKNVPSQHEIIAVMTHYR